MKSTNSKTNKFKFYPDVGRQNYGPQNVHNLIPKSYECITLHGKKDFKGVIKLIILR